MGTDQQLDERYMVGTLLKAIDIMNLLGDRPMQPAQIAAQLDLNKSTLHRMLYTLEHAGYVERMQDGRSYRLGMKLVQLASTRLNDVQILTEAKPHLLQLVKEIHQAVHLGILNRNSAVFIDKIDVMNTIRMYSAIGRSIPIHCSAIGKALVLDRSDDEVRLMLAEAGMERFTPYTLATPDALLAQLQQARIDGFTHDDGEHEAEVCCVAVPVYDYRGSIVAAISTAAQRESKNNQEYLVAQLKRTAQSISRSLGYDAV